MSGVLLRDVAGGVARLTLNRPDKRNALNAELVAALKDGLAQAAADPEVRVVAIAGAGSVFCAGADLAEMARIADMSYEENLADARSLGALFALMRAHPRPLIALVAGHAFAGGCGLASACDVVLAAEGVELGYPEVQLGFVPALVMTILRRKVGEGVAFDLVARGRNVDAAEAHRIGLVTHVFPAETFDQEAAAYLADLAKRPPSAVERTKKLLYELDGLGFEDGLERAAHVNAEARMTEACREGVRRFLERHG